MSKNCFKHFSSEERDKMGILLLEGKNPTGVAKELFKRYPEIKKTKLWGGNFWTNGYYANTVSKYKNEKSIQEYVQNQGEKYTRIYKGQLKFFEGIA